MCKGDEGKNRGNGDNMKGREKKANGNGKGREGKEHKGNEKGRRGKDLEGKILLWEGETEALRERRVVSRKGRFEWEGRKIALRANKGRKYKGKKTILYKRNGMKLVA